MGSGGRTWTTVIAFPKIVRALDASGRRAVLADIGRFRIDVPDDPMRKKTGRRIRIIADQNKRLCLVWYAVDFYFRIHVRSIAGKFCGDVATRLERRSGDRNGGSGIHIENYSNENREGQRDRFH